MAFEDIKNWTFKIFKTLSKNEMARVIITIRNQVEEQLQENKKLKDENQKLKDQINHLKGEKGKPDIKPATDKNNNEDDDSDDDEQDKNKDEKKPKNKNHKNGDKKSKIKITRVEKIAIDKSKLPMDAQSKGHREIIIQDINISPDNIQFIIPVYYSPSEAKSYEGEIPVCYKGSEFGPGIWAFIKQFHFEGRITQNVLWQILRGFGVKISEGQINTIIQKNRGVDMRGEMDAAREEGILKQIFSQIDDTGARINGKNAATIAVTNDYMTYFFTNPSKNRLSAINALAGAKGLSFCINDVMICYIEDKVKKPTLVNKLRELMSDKVYSRDEFEEEIINTPLLIDALDAWKKHIREGAAIGALRSEILGPRSMILICDDAPQFKGILEYIGLCWIHEIRHYKKLEPSHVEFKEILDDFLEVFWDFYDLLLLYKERPSKRMRKKIETWFEDLFTRETNYYSLNLLKKKTFAKKDSLLLVLDYPEIPLHNNASELSVREKVVQRDIKHCFRTWNGALVNDLALSIMLTCRKLGVSFSDYLRDRFFYINQIPTLAELIFASP